MLEEEKPTDSTLESIPARQMKVLRIADLEKKLAELMDLREANPEDERIPTYIDKYTKKIAAAREVKTVLTLAFTIK